MKIQATQTSAYNLMHEGVLAFSRAERAGLRVDVNYCRRKIAQTERKAKHYLHKFEKSPLAKLWKQVYGAKYNPDSGPQLGTILYKEKKIKPPKLTSSGNGSVDEDALNQLNLSDLQYLLRARKQATIKNRLNEFLREQANGYVHPFIDLHHAKTYRPATSNPNLANIPKRDKEQMNACRYALYPRPGHQLLEVDFSGIEVSTGCPYHKDPNMIVYVTDPNTDMHSDVSAQVFIIDDFDKTKHPEHKYLRDATKNSFVFPQFYGDYYEHNAQCFCKWIQLPINGRWKEGQGVAMPGGVTIADHLKSKGVSSYNKFVQHIKKIEEDFWENRFRVYGQWRKDWVKAYQRKGYFDMLTGFRCKGIMQKNNVINYPIQGTAFHCLLWCFIRVDEIAKEEGWDSRLINQIYDSMILDVNPDERDHVAKTIHTVTTKELLEHWPWINVPLNVDMDVCEVDEPWAKKRAFELPN